MGFGRALNEDSVSKAKKATAKSIGGDQKCRFLDPLGERNREGADVFTRLTTLARQGVGG